MLINLVIFPLNWLGIVNISLGMPHQLSLMNKFLQFIIILIYSSIFRKIKGVKSFKPPK